ncbi:MAG: copper resistance protein NlpE N-terminal domain-containing protein [bacterium]
MKTILFLFFIIIALSGCNKPEEKSKQELKISGPFSGIIPCADCEGIYYVLTLKSDSTYNDKMSYMGKNVSPVDNSGKWSFIDSNKIKLNTKDGATSRLLISGGNLIMLDGDGKKIEGPAADKFILTPGILKMPEVTTADTIKKSAASNSINGMWTLSEIDGQKVDKTIYKNGLPNIDIREADNKFSGSTGCNRINGASTIVGNEVVFTKFITTRMSCPGTGESEFITALTSIDSYKADKAMLILLSKGKSIMKFTK